MASHRPCASHVVFSPRNTTRSPSKKVECPLFRPSTGDLSFRIDERRRPEVDQLPWNNAVDRKDIVREFRGIAEAVAHLHSLGIVHRDIKPGNVLVMESGELRLSDFGLVKNLAPSDKSLMNLPSSSEGGVKGTRDYMSPEQERGERIGKQADVYALGILLAELACGRKPQPNAQVQAGSTLSNWEPLRGLPSRVRRLVLRCTNVEFVKRHEDADALLQAFLETTNVADASGDELPGE